MTLPPMLLCSMRTGRLGFTSIVETVRYLCQVRSKDTSIQDYIDAFDDACTHWSKYSGEKNYPVPSTTEGLGSIGEYGKGDLYVGKQLLLRINLLEFVVYYLNEVLHRQTSKPKEHYEIN